MQGVILQVAVSNGGLPKLPASGGLVCFLGIAGDADSPRWGMSGLYASVIEPGPMQPDDIIVAVDRPA
jgi:hypothetical protein